MDAESKARKLIVGYDGREETLPALRVGLGLHELFGFEMEVLFVSDIREASRASRGLESMWEEREAERRKEVRQKVASVLDGSGLGVDDVLVQEAGHPVHELLERIWSTHPELLVLGPHRRRDRFDFGGTARGILAHANCSIWMQPGPVRPIRRILVPTDFSTCGSAALAHARGLAQGLGAAVTLLHVYVPPSFALAAGTLDAGAWIEPDVVREHRQDQRELLEGELGAIDWGEVEHDCELVDGSPEEVILGRAEECDLVVLGTHGRSGLAAAFLGSVAYRVLGAATVPVVAVRAPGGRWLIGGDEGRQ